MKKKNDFSSITLEQLAQMVAKGFGGVDKRFEAVDKRFEQVDKRFEGIDKRFEELRTEMNAGFGYINITLDKHMGDVRKQTDGLARRVKRLEEVVFKE